MVLLLVFCCIHLFYYLKGTSWLGKKRQQSLPLLLQHLKNLMLFLDPYFIHHLRGHFQTALSNLGAENQTLNMPQLFLMVLV